jgi:ferredoxin
MKTEIYYFSGTGNSLYVARELQKKIPNSSLIPIIRLLNKNMNIKTNAAVIGFVFPVHALTIPISVKRFLKKVDISTAEYIFAIATRGSTFFRGFELMDQLLARKKKQLHAHFILTMGLNDPKHESYQDPGDDEIFRLETIVQKRLNSIKNIILNKRISREKDIEYTVGFSYHPLINYLLEKTVLWGMAFSEYIGGVNYFYTDDKCTGCGICEEICLAQKIKMRDKRPVWQKNVFCYMCYACINFCPVKAIQINSIPGVKSFTTTSGRYSHPYAKVKDIALQKKEEAG